MSGTNGSSPDELRENIVRQREQVAQTVDALHHELESTAKAAVKPAAVAAGVALVALVGFLVWRRRR